MASPSTDDQESSAPPRRERPSLLTDIAVALLLLVADAVIVVVAGLLFLAVGLGTAPSPRSSSTARSRDTPAVTWLIIWGAPAVAAAGAFVHARLRMPVTAVVQGLFTLACLVLAVAWTRMLLS
ncbi:hypothetical protein ACIPSH_33650 [Streptomyces iakyrus]|uniref:hypothetical protein n=1 Tax=Streptomyces iakyrus TaxID=68219 RepID=UPI00380EFA07